MKIAVIGFGKIGRDHVRNLMGSNFFDLVALCSRSAPHSDLDSCPDCVVVRDIDELLLRPCVPDVVLIATPHLAHAGDAIKALEAGVHVICEKPMSVSTRHADAMVQAAMLSSATLTVISQTRFEPSYRSAKSIIDSGRLGDVRRISMTETFWRSDAYYRSGDWRGTWAGEGGGVIVNQAPHVIDRYAWFAGRPDRVSAHCETVLHDLPVEDSATLILSHDNGIQGHIHISTNEYPPICRMEIACDLGRVIIDHGNVSIQWLDESIREATKNGEITLGAIGFRTEQRGGVLLNWSPELMHQVYEDFAQAIWTHCEPEVTDKHALDAVEIMNAAHLSAWTGQSITLPVNRDQYDQFASEMKRREADKSEVSH